MFATTGRCPLELVVYGGAVSPRAEGMAVGVSAICRVTRILEKGGSGFVDPPD
jgi:hypothetical protein